jgi:hypothetical protein
MAKEMAIVIKQRDSMFGPSVVYITNHAFKIDCVTRGIAATSKAPLWKVCISNSRSRRFFECAPEDIPNGYAPWTEIGDHPIVQAQWSEKVGNPINGQKTRLLKADLGPSNPRANVAPGCSKRITMDYLVLAKSTLTAKMCDVIARFKRLPPKSGIPLRFDYTDKDGNSHNGLETLSLQQSPIDDSIFAYPVGWQKLKSMNEVLVDVPYIDVVKDFLMP